MSLINDALKKAQRQRAVGAAPLAAEPGETAGGRVEKRGRPMTFRHVVLLLAVAAVLVLVAVVATVYFLRRPARRETAVAVAPVKPVPAAQRESRTASATTPPAPAVSGPPVVVVHLPSLAPPPAKSAPAPAEAEARAATPPPAAAAPAQPDPRVLAFLDTLRIGGIRAAAGDSRVLMNDRVFRVNDIVSYDLGLRLRAINADSLQFVDARGAVYTKEF